MKPGYVYVLFSENRFKIGMTKSPKKRIGNIQTASPFMVEVVAYQYSKDCLALERWLHDEFSDKRVKGEWFSLSADDIESLYMFLDCEDSKVSGKKESLVSLRDNRFGVYL